MKLSKLTGLYGAAVFALLLSVTSCKKSSSNSSGTNSVTFQMNGKSVSMTAVADTTAPSQILITALGAIPGTKDTATLTLALLDYETTGASTYIGNFPDTATATSPGSYAQFDDVTSGYELGDNFNVSGNVFNSDVTFNNGVTIRGTFKGMLYWESGNAPDSIAITNGNFNVQL